MAGLGQRPRLFYGGSKTFSVGDYMVSGRNQHQRIGRILRQHEGGCCCCRRGVASNRF